MSGVDIQRFSLIRSGKIFQNATRLKLTIFFFIKNMSNSSNIDDDNEIDICGERKDCWLNDKIQYKKSQLTSEFLKSTLF